MATMTTMKRHLWRFGGHLRLVSRTCETTRTDPNWNSKRKFAQTIGSDGARQISSSSPANSSSLTDKSRRVRVNRAIRLGNGELVDFEEGVEIQKNERLEKFRERLREEKDGPSFQSFMQHTERKALGGLNIDVEGMLSGNGRKYHVETFGCQMNVADSEIVSSVLEQAGYVYSPRWEQADVVLVNTCAIRDGAEERAMQRLRTLKRSGRKSKQLGVLGCMAERMKDRLFEKNLVNVVVGPDSYRDLPNLLSVARGDLQAMNVQLSIDETYGDIAPVREGDSVHAFISIMRGCNNLCSYCIVPFTRGRERSRSVKSILEEVEQVAATGRIKDITLLGQNVNSYHDKTEASTEDEDTYSIVPGFSDRFRSRGGGGIRFGELLDLVASVDPTIRIRFTSPHPKDFTDDVLHVIAKHPNISKGIHLPAQSGSNRVLERMIRGYTREAYLDLVQRARDIIGPELELSSDFITGFCGETEEDHLQTLSLLETVQYEQAFMFAYSERERTRAYHRLEDDVPEETKQRRLAEIISLFRKTAQSKSDQLIGRKFTVLVEGPSKRNPEVMQGRTNGLRRCVIEDSTPETCPPGSFVDVTVTHANVTTIRGKINP